jgi:uncharacterized protein YndB with AHSA1/START domain
MKTFVLGWLAAVSLMGNGAFASDAQVTEGFINLPVTEVWKLFTTAEGYKKTGVADAEVDLRIGGAIRSHYDPKGRLGDSETIVNEILAFDPERMLTMRIKQAPASFPHKDVAGDIWTVIYFTAAGAGMTQVKIVGLGYTSDPKSQALRHFFEAGNKATLDRIAKQYWPQCALCKQEATSAAQP